jgi:hypothetical protein
MALGNGRDQIDVVGTDGEKEEGGWDLGLKLRFTGNRDRGDMCDVALL